MYNPPKKDKYYFEHVAKMTEMLSTSDKTLDELKAIPFGNVLSEDKHKLLDAIVNIDSVKIRSERLLQSNLGKRIAWYDSRSDDAAELFLGFNVVNHENLLEISNTLDNQILEGLRLKLILNQYKQTKILSKTDEECVSRSLKILSAGEIQVLTRDEPELNEIFKDTVWKAILTKSILFELDTIDLYILDKDLSNINLLEQSHAIANAVWLFAPSADFETGISVLNNLYETYEWWTTFRDQIKHLGSLNAICLNNKYAIHDLLVAYNTNIETVNEIPGFEL